ncbi:hypothetical protein [Streptomyces europaeiscabiei]|uniref:hypothetical protein n=1 Tax=Streptomyces europaeiscabiei TaxID=146819 RepID=UPI0029AA1E90|nr:hypothetical protein [Streptomyces europaeiscabiei]MDX3611308.1 hypothetical protein [Streptomyces europaeiscabiei]
MTDDSIDVLKTAARVDGEHLHRTELERLGAALTPGREEEFIDAVTRVCGLSWASGRTRPADWLELHDDLSWVDIGESANRAGLLRAALASVVVECGTVSRFTSVELAAHCLAVVADLTACRVIAEPSALHAVIVLRPGPHVLPAELADTVHQEDFREFTEQLLASATGTPRLTDGGVALTVQRPAVPEVHG